MLCLNLPVTFLQPPTSIISQYSTEVKKGLRYEPGKGILWKSKNIFQAENADFTQPGAHHLEHHCT